MDEAPKRSRWYQYEPPPWFPGWLVACVAVGTSTYLAFWYGLNETSWKIFGLSFGLGFGMMLCILVLVAAKARPDQRNSGLYPPIYIRLPIFAAFVVGPGLTMVCEEQITTGASRGNRVIAQGPAVVVFGFVIMTAPIPWNVWLLRRQPRSVPERVAAAAALVVVVVGFGIGFCRLVGYL